jgi:hypothetical protein
MVRLLKKRARRGAEALSKAKCLIVVLLLVSAIPKISIVTLASSNDEQGPVLELYTQKVFAPQELVMLYALATYNGAPVAQKDVAFQVNGPSNPFLNITTVGSAPTNQDGIAEFSFRIPWPNTNPEEQVFGTWFAIATVSIADQTVIDTLTFQVGWIISITNIQTLNASAQPQTVFLRNQTIMFNLTIQNIALTPKTATITIDAQDAASYPIIHVQQENLTFQPGISYLSASAQIPTAATLGQASVQAAPYTMPPENGGVPYSPAITTTFEIITVQVITHHVIITAVKPSSTSATSGQTVDITITAKNVGNATESFNVTAYYDKTPIGKRLVADLEPQAEASVVIPWNTSGVLPGTYVISGVADTVPGETNTSGKTYVDGTVTILAPPLPFIAFYLVIFFMFTLASAVIACLAMFLILGYQRRLRRKKRRPRSFALVARPRV